MAYIDKETDSRNDLLREIIRSGRRQSLEDAIGEITSYRDKKKIEGRLDPKAFKAMFRSKHKSRAFDLFGKGKKEANEELSEWVDNIMSMSTCILDANIDSSDSLIDTLDDVLPNNEFAIMMLKVAAARKENSLEGGFSLRAAAAIERQKSLPTPIQLLPRISERIKQGINARELLTDGLLGIAVGGSLKTAATLGVASLGVTGLGGAMIAGGLVGSVVAGGREWFKQTEQFDPLVSGSLRRRFVERLRNPVKNVEWSKIGVAAARGGVIGALGGLGGGWIADKAAEFISSAVHVPVMPSLQGVSEDIASVGESPVAEVLPEVLATELELVQIPSEIFLEQGSNPWEVSRTYLGEILGRTPTNLEILTVTKELAKSSGISVPEWNIMGEGFLDHRNLPVGFKLIFNV